MNEDIILRGLLQKIEDLTRENERLKMELERVESQLKEYKRWEFSIRETLAEAQQLAEDYKNNAKREAELIIKEAEMKAEQILNKSNNRR